MQPGAKEHWTVSLGAKLAGPSKLQPTVQPDFPHGWIGVFLFEKTRLLASLRKVARPQVSVNHVSPLDSALSSAFLRTPGTGRGSAERLWIGARCTVQHHRLQLHHRRLGSTNSAGSISCSTTKCCKEVFFLNAPGSKTVDWIFRQKDLGSPSPVD